MREFDDAQSQYFSLPQPLIHYLFKNAKAIHLRKLYQCCKLFPVSSQINVACGLEINLYSVVLKFYEDFHKISPTTKIIKNIWVGKRKIPQTKSWRIQPTEVTSFIRKFDGWNLKYLRLDQISLQWNDFQLLTKSGTIETFQCSAKILDPSSGEIMSIKDIISQLPNAYDISIFYEKSTNIFNKPTISRNLLQQFERQRKVKIENLIIYRLDSSWDMEDFLEFLKENISPTAKIIAHCLISFNYQRFEMAVNAELINSGYNNILFKAISY